MGVPEGAEAIVPWLHRHVTHHLMSINHALTRADYSNTFNRLFYCCVPASTFFAPPPLCSILPPLCTFDSALTMRLREEIVFGSLQILSSLPTCTGLAHHLSRKSHLLWLLLVTPKHLCITGRLACISDATLSSCCNVLRPHSCTRHHSRCICTARNK